MRPAVTATQTRAYGQPAQDTARPTAGSYRTWSSDPASAPRMTPAASPPISSSSPLPDPETPLKKNGMMMPPR
jgi:hypothetical protein